MATTKVSKGLIKDKAITIEKLNDELVVTEAEGIVNNDNDITVPTSASVKDYVDSTGVKSVVAGENVTVDSTDPLNPIVNSIQATVSSSNSNFINTSVNVNAGDFTITSSLNATGTPSATAFLRGDNAWSTAVTGLTVGNSSFINLSNVGTSNVPDVTATLSANGTPDSTTFLRGDNTWAAPVVSLDLQQVTDIGNTTTNSITIESLFLNDASTSNGVIYYDNVEDRVTLANYNTGGSVYVETNGGSYVAKFNSDTSTELTGNLTVGGSTTANSFIANGGTSSDFLKADGSLDSNSYALAGNYITSLTGEATASGPGSAAVTLTNSAVIGKTISGVNITGGTIAATDTILTAFGKLQNQINGLIGSTKYEGVWDASTNTPTITSGSGTDGSYYIVNVAGTTNIDGISNWSVGDWIIFHDAAWQKVDNTDAVVSVNGQTGAVSLTTSNINEGTNLYYTDARVNANTAVAANTAARHSAVTIGTANGLGLSGQQISLGLASTSTTGALSSTDWNNFNDKTDNTGTVTSVTVNSGSGLSGSGTVTSTGTITLSHADTSAQASVDNSGATVIQDVTLDTYGHVTGLASKTITLGDLGYTGATNANYITNNNQLTNGAGYTTNIGDITGVTAGNGISGGGTSGTVTINHADTSAQGSVNNSGNTVIQDVTLDTYGHVTGLVSSTITNISGNAATATLAANSTLAGGLAVGTGVNNSANQIVRTNASGYADFGWINTVSGNTTNPVTDIYVNTNDGYIRKATPAHFRSQITDGVYYPNSNPNGYTSNVGDITGVTAGTNLTGGGTSGTVTLNLASTIDVTRVDIGNEIQLKESADRADLLEITSVTSGWAGIQLRNSSNEGRWSLMTDGSLFGVYDDENSDWGMQFDENGECRLYHNASEKLNTTSSGVTVTGDLTVTGGDIVLSGTGRIQGIDTVSASTDAANKSYVDNFQPLFYAGDGLVPLATPPPGFNLGAQLATDLRGAAWLIGPNTGDYIEVGTTVINFVLDTATDMRLYNNGDLHVEGDVIAYSTSVSDIRLKDNIKTIDNALDKVEKLRGVEYDWNKGSRKGQHEIGVIAQEVEEVFPFLVREKVKSTGEFENNETAYKTVDYEKLVGVLIESVKELSAKIKTLEAKIQ